MNAMILYDVLALALALLLLLLLLLLLRESSPGADCSRGELVPVLSLLGSFRPGQFIHRDGPSPRAGNSMPAAGPAAIIQCSGPCPCG